MQDAAQQAVTEPTSRPAADEPTASLVAIDNRTGEVRAMVGGPARQRDGPTTRSIRSTSPPRVRRQPGSAFKPFTLAVALEHGYSADSVFDSKPIDIQDPKACGQAHYRPRNFDNEYEGPVTLATATAQSDNSVFTQLGLSPDIGTRRIAAMAHASGIRTPISTNCAMIIGGLREGVSPLDMAHAYETFAEGGRRVYNPQLGSPDQGPVGINEILCPDVKCRGRRKIVDSPSYRQVMPAAVADQVHDLLSGVVSEGTGQAAAIPGVDVVGKTGTTNNEGDAWFVGWTPQITTAVWVGFPNKLVPMLTQYNGGPVTGGTFPAEIWRTFTEAAISISHEENAQRAARARSSSKTTTTGSDTDSATVPAQTTPVPATVPTTGDTTPAGGGAATTPATVPSSPATTPAPTPSSPATTPAPAPTPSSPATTPAPAPAPTPTTGGGGSAGGGSSGTTGGAGIGG